MIPPFNPAPQEHSQTTRWQQTHFVLFTRSMLESVKVMQSLLDGIPRTCTKAATHGKSTLLGSWPTSCLTSSKVCLHARSSRTALRRSLSMAHSHLHRNNINKPPLLPRSQPHHRTRPLRLQLSGISESHLGSQKICRRIRRYCQEIHPPRWHVIRTIRPQRRPPTLSSQPHMVLRLLPRSYIPPSGYGPCSMGRTLRQHHPPNRMRTIIGNRNLRSPYPGKTMSNPDGHSGNIQCSQNDIIWSKPVFVRIYSRSWRLWCNKGVTVGRK